MDMKNLHLYKGLIMINECNYWLMGLAIVGYGLAAIVWIATTNTIGYGG